MAPKSLLDLPVTIREQIYTELLGPRPAEEGSYTFAPRDVSINILYTNRQIYAESSDVFYGRNLFVLVQSDYYSFSRLLLKPPAAVCFLSSRSVDEIHRSASHGRFALSMEMLSLSVRFVQTKPFERAAFVITARNLRCLVDDLAIAFRRPQRVTLVEFQIYNTFRYTIPRFSELVFGPLLSMPLLPTFKALSIQGPLEPDYYQRLMTKILHNQDRIWFDFAGEFASYRSRVNYNMRPMIANSDHLMRWNFSDLRFILRALDIVWKFHASLGFQHNKHHAQASLFQSVADVYSTLIFAHLIEAKRHPDRAVSHYLDARRAAEEGIRYLNRDDRFVGGSTFETFPAHVKEENMTLTGRAKAILSLKASKVCTKLGDKAAASQYITDAHRHDANMSPTSRELLLRLEWKDLPDPHMLREECKGLPVFWRRTTRDHVSL